MSDIRGAAPRRFLAIAVVLAVTGCTSGPSNSPSPPPSGELSAGAASPSAVPTSAAPSPNPARPVVISDARATRLLRVGDPPASYNAEELRPDRLSAVVTLPCAGAAPASDAQLVERHGVGLAVGLQEGHIDSHAAQALTLYRPGGAAAYLAELTAALASCTVDANQNTWTVAARDFAGDGSVLVERRFLTSHNPSDPPIASSDYRAVIRADDVVMVLDVGPLESGLTPRAIVDAVIDVAIKRAED